MLFNMFGPNKQVSRFNENKMPLVEP